MNISYPKVLWIIIHLLTDFIETIYYFGLEFRENLTNFLINFINISQSRRVHNLFDDCQIIESRIKEIPKLPKHLAVILSSNSENELDVRKLTSLVIWALSSGVEFISFYDYKGIIKHELASTLYKQIEQHEYKDDSVKIIWGPHYQIPSEEGIKFPKRNDYKKQIIVNLYSSDDGQERFNDLLTLECHDKLKNAEAENLTIDYIDSKLGKLYGCSDPDLAIFFGSFCCTMGFLPWHIRLTEFIPISNRLHNISLDKYLQVLYKYGKCEQRFGK